MKKEVLISKGITVDIDRLKVVVSGEVGKLEKDFSNPMFQNEIKIRRASCRERV